MTSNKISKSKAIVPTTGTDIQPIRPSKMVFNFDDFDNMIRLAEYISKSSFSPLKSAEEVIAAVATGAEIGMSPMTAIMLGRKLVSKDSLAAVIRGKSLGLDPIAAIENVYTIKDKQSVGVHIISKILMDCEVEINILKDFEPVYRYKIISSDKTKNGKIFTEQEYEELKDQLQVIVLEIAKPENMDKTKTQVIKEQYTKETKIRFIRKNKNLDITLSYTLEDAQIAGWYRVLDSTGKPVPGYEGKDNWNNNPKTMLRNRVITIGGRIIAADKLNGIREIQEVYDLEDNIEDNDNVDSTIILNEKDNSNDTQ